MAFEVFPWNEWIRLLIGGDVAPFINGLQRSVYGYRFLRGKSAEDLRRDYGSEVERQDIFQEVFAQTLHLLDAAGERSDEELARDISIIIRRVVGRLYSRAQRERIMFLPGDSDPLDEREPAYRDTPDSRPTPEAACLTKEMMGALLRELTPLQASVLRGHQRFGLGPYSTRELASVLGKNLKAVEKQVTVVSSKVRKFALRNGYLTPSDDPVRVDRAAKTATEAAGKIRKVNPIDAHTRSGD